MDEARLRQRSLLPREADQPLPQEIESKVFELLVQLLLSAVPVVASEGGARHEQDRQ